MDSQPREVFITGATGFMGSRLAAELLRRGHRVRALARPGSEAKLPAGCDVVHGDALRAETYRERISPADTFVHLIGVAHPNPSKAAEFRDIDLKSCREAVGAASDVGVRHFVYLSVARPAPIMQEYQAVARRGRTAHPPEWPEGDVCASLVCARAGAQVAVTSGSHVCNGAAVPANARVRRTDGAGDGGTDDAGVSVGGGESAGADSHSRAAPDPQRRWRTDDGQTRGRVSLTDSGFTVLC